MKKALIIIGLLAGIGLVTWWFGNPVGALNVQTDKTPSVTQAAQEEVGKPPTANDQPRSLSDLPERDRTAINMLKSIYTAPISVYGKVVDDKGAFIVGATVEYSLNDKYFKEGTKGTTLSDGMGRFKIEGSGVSVYVSVQKTGFYRIPERSCGPVRANAETSLEQPVVFVLKTAGMPQSLTHATVRGHGMPIDGTPKEINLGGSKLLSVGQGHIRIEVWVEGGPPLGQKYNNFPWHYRLSVPGGGMIDRTDQLAFEAPTDGYQPYFEGSFKPYEKWHSSVEKEIYVRLPNNTYARGKLHLGVDTDDASVSFNSYWNQSGSRNLEFGADWAGDAK
jgi:hypothetical protein